MMTWVAVGGVLRGNGTMCLYIVAATLFILSQATYFFLNKVRGNKSFEARTRLTSFQVVCKRTSVVIDGTREYAMDGSWVAIALETTTVIFLYWAWCSFTQGDYGFGFFYRLDGDSRNVLPIASWRGR